MITFSRSLPAIRGSSASNVPSSSLKPAFSYFQGLPVKTWSFPEDSRLKQLVKKTPAVKVSIVHFASIRLGFRLEGAESLKFKTRNPRNLLLTYIIFFLSIIHKRDRSNFRIFEPH